MSVKVPKPDASALYRAVKSFASAEGTFRAGETLRGSHEVVQKRPELFVPVGLSDAEERAAFLERFGHARGSAR